MVMNTQTCISTRIYWNDVLKNEALIAKFWYLKIILEKTWNTDVVLNSYETMLLGILNNVQYSVLWGQHQTLLTMTFLEASPSPGSPHPILSKALSIPYTIHVYPLSCWLSSWCPPPPPNYPAIVQDCFGRLPFQLQIIDWQASSGSDKDNDILQTYIIYTLLITCRNGTFVLK